MLRGKRIYPFKSDDYSKFDDYDGSTEKVTALVDYFTQKWNWPKPVPRYAICAMAHRLKKSRVKEPFWTPREEEYLRNNLGLVSDRNLCKHLKRTRVSIKLKAKRLHINKTLNINTARSVAFICGIPDSHTVMMWVRKGLLKAKRTPTETGHNRMWNIDDNSLAKMLKVQPWLAYLPDMPDSYYKRLVEREWARDPWFTREQVAKMIGIGPNYVRSYIRRGWIQAVKVPGGRHSQVRWMFRQSWVMAFLQNDPRKKYSQQLMSTNKRGKHLLTDDAPVHLYSVWLMKCPRCGKIVAISVAHRRNWGSHVKQAYLDSLDGHQECIHSQFVALEGTHALFKRESKVRQGTRLLAATLSDMPREDEALPVKC